MPYIRGKLTPQEMYNLIDKPSIYYDFLRPHLSLKEKTPAEIASIELNLSNNR